MHTNAIEEFACLLLQTWKQREDERLHDGSKSRLEGYVVGIK